MLNYILILGGIQGILLAAIILAKGRYVANRFLAAFIALLGLGCLLDNNLGLIEDIYYIIFWVGNSFLFAPLLYLYVKNVVKTNNEFGVFYIHLLPFLVIKTLVLYSFFTDSLGEEFWISVGVFLNYFLICFNLIYLFYSFKCINNQSHINANIKPTRLIITLLLVYTAYNLVFLVRRLIEQFCLFEISHFENYLYIGVALIIYLISGLIVYQPDILQFRKKYTKSSINTEESVKYGQEIEKYLKTTKPFLDPDFNFSTMCLQLGLHKHQVSQIIGQYFNVNFYELINRYRVEEFCQRIGLNEHKKKSILGVAMDCGYQSKSTFNAAFKKLKNMSPSEYVKRQ